MGACCVVQFAKSPVLGRVKTRMQPDLSQQASLQLHCRLLQHTCANLGGAGENQAQADWDFQLWFSEPLEHCGSSRSQSVAAPLSPEVMTAAANGQLQQGADLGERMAHCFETLLGQYQQVILVGSDCPYLQPMHIRRVQAALQAGHEAVLVPAHDGGYVLIALQQFAPQLFNGIAWGTDQVLRQSLAVIDQLQWRCQLLAPLSDVDNPQDLAQLMQWSQARALLGNVFYDDLSRRRA